MKIFFIDDSDLVIGRLTAMLAYLHGVKIVGKAHDLYSSIECINKLEPDVIFLNTHLLQGIEIPLAHHLKKMKIPPVIILISHYSYPQYQRRYLEAGADYFFDLSTELEKVPSTLLSLMLRRVA